MIPASIRNNNPGAMWPGPSATRFGSLAKEQLTDKQKNQMATFQTSVQGAAAQFDLLYRVYTGKTLFQALKTWGGGNSPEAYTAIVSKRTGLNRDGVLTKCYFEHPTTAIEFCKAMAWHEAGTGSDYPMTDDEWKKAHAMAFGKTFKIPAADTATVSIAETVPVPRPPTPPIAGQRLSIVNGRLRGARFVSANSFGGALKPELIILHDTAGRLDPFNSVAWFKSGECKTSAHVVVDRDGTITQMVPFNRKAFHAGQSVWKGRSLCNGFSVGIEIVNPGIMDAQGKAWFGKATDAPLKKASTKEHGSGYWLDYTPEQIAAVKSLCRALVEEYPDCNEIATHWLISPGRKIDTNPLFPLEGVRAFALGTETDHPDDSQVAASADILPQPRAFVVPAADVGTVTPRDLAPVSKKVSVLRTTSGFLHSIWLSIAGLFTLDNFGFAKGVINDVQGLVQQLALPIGFVAAICGVMVVRYVIGRIKADYEDGRYIPSGQ